MKKVTFEFVGQDAEEMAQKFYTWFVDGGLEDQWIVNTFSNNFFKGIFFKLSWR